MTHRILVVDDDPRLIHIVKLYLETDGYDVAEASSGADGIALLDTFKPELAIVDIMMAGMDGVEVCQRIRANPNTSAIPVLMFSALSSSADVERARAAGANHMITKPYSLDGLGEVVRNALAKNAAAGGAQASPTG